MKKILVFVFLFELLGTQSYACMTIICEAVCAKYEAMTQTITWGPDKFSNNFYQLRSTKVVYMDGDKGYVEIFNQLKQKCSGSGEVLIAPGETAEAKVKGPPTELVPSKACKKINEEYKSSTSSAKGAP